MLYVPQDEWLALRRGTLSYRRFPLGPEALEPIDGSAAHRSGSDGMPVVDIRYISGIDKTALAAHYEKRFPLRGTNKVPFADWIGARFARESFQTRSPKRSCPRLSPALSACGKPGTAADHQPAGSVKFRPEEGEGESSGGIPPLLSHHLCYH